MYHTVQLQAIESMVGGQVPATAVLNSVRLAAVQALASDLGGAIFHQSTENSGRVSIRCRG
jgi:DNA-binding FrmR family transcriptional regulator